MSDASRQSLKVSREGIVLIKSFEGFRPRAIQRENGGWVIGYGHTLSAREGATVSESDAELLLRYDLLPVEKTVNETVPGDLNQHQFDALVSFAFSVGVDRFAGSDVRQRLNAGAPGEAADAIMGWPEPALPETALRRRAAERALFVANPDTPVALSDLLSAPLPPPAVATLAAPEPLVATPAEPEADASAEPTARAAAEPGETLAPIDSRGAAVAALLGETADAVIVPFGRPVVQTEPTEPFGSEPAGQDAPVEASTEIDADFTADAASTPDVDPAPEPAAAPDTDAEPVAETAPDADKADTAPVADTAVWAAARYAPYSSMMIGPLPYLQPAVPVEEPAATTETPAITHPAVEEVVTAPDEARPIEISSPAQVDTAPVETAPVQTDAIEAAPDRTDPVEPAPGGWTSVAPVPATELVLTPLEDAPELAIARPLWTPEQRDEPDGSENNLFGEDLSLTLGGGSIMRHEIEMEAPARFDWKETGPFIFMGGVGLVSFGASMAAFRRAAEQSGGGDLTIIGWVLALIGLACVGVSSVNLYRKFGLPGGD